MNRTKARPHPRPIPPPLRGSGTKNYVAKFISSTTLGNSQIFDNGNNVGVATANPTDKLDVRGNIKLGSSGALFGPGGVENLLILRGQVNQDGSSWGQIGFSVSKPATGRYVVTLTTSPPFPGSCLAVVTPVSEDGSLATAVITQWTGGNVFSFSVSTFDSSGTLADRTFFFIAVVARL
jgi:hypothetical protein